MKNLSLILNGVLFVLVGILFYLHFFASPNSNSQSNIVFEKDTNQINAPIPQFHNLGNTSGKVVFIDYDSLVQNYDFFKKIQKDLEVKLRNAESEMVSKQKKLEEDYQAYMQGQSMMTDQHKATKEAQLQQQNAELMQLRDEKTRQFSNQEQELNEKLLNKLYGYFRKMAKQNNFSYILTYKRGIPGVVYGSDSLDITKQVVEGLNAEYRAK
ncbi:MAG: OmpH family outer membrane protein [Cytophagales bacterium]|nr:MAG: OmpH family outer membrane protein [Cytophagales bacterium]